jgi:hypothetical protein
VNSTQVAASLAAWTLEMKKKGAMPSDIFAATFGFTVASAVVMGWPAKKLCDMVENNMKSMKKLSEELP